MTLVAQYSHLLIVLMMHSMHPQMDLLQSHETRDSIYLIKKINFIFYLSAFYKNRIIRYLLMRANAIFLILIIMGIFSKLFINGIHNDFNE